MLSFSMQLGAGPAILTSEERELALCTFKPTIIARTPVGRLRDSAPSIVPLTREERELALCSFKPKINSTRPSTCPLTPVARSPVLSQEERELSVCTFKPVTTGTPLSVAVRAAHPSYNYAAVLPCKPKPPKQVVNPASVYYSLAGTSVLRAGKQRSCRLVGMHVRDPTFKPRTSTFSSTSFISIGDKYQKGPDISDTVYYRAKPSLYDHRAPSTPSRPPREAARVQIQLEAGVDVSSAAFARWLAAAPEESTDDAPRELDPWKLDFSYFAAIAPMVERLDLARLGWGAAEAIALSAALPRFTSCTTLDLVALPLDSGSVLTGSRLGVDGAVALARAIAVCPSLTHIDVRGNDIAGEGAAELSAAVLGKPTIESFNCIPVKEMRADALSELNLSKTQIGVEGAMVVAGLLPYMASMTHITASGKIDSMAMEQGKEEGGGVLSLGWLGDEGWGAIVAAVCSSEVSKIAYIDTGDFWCDQSRDETKLIRKLIRKALRTLVNPSLTYLGLNMDVSENDEKLMFEAATVGVRNEAALHSLRPRQVRDGEGEAWECSNQAKADHDLVTGVKRFPFVLALGQEVE